MLINALNSLVFNHFNTNSPQLRTQQPNTLFTMKKKLTLDMFPEGFKIISGYVTDMHLYTPIERACERLMRECGLRNGPKDRLWRFAMRDNVNLELARELFSRMRNVTPCLVSGGDQFLNLVTPNGLAERLARFCAFDVLDFFEAFKWDWILWPPGDHCLGIPHAGTSEETLHRLNNVKSRFESSPEFRIEESRLMDKYKKDLGMQNIIREPSLRNSQAAVRSQTFYAHIFGPLFGKKAVAPNLDFVWASDVLTQDQGIFGLGSLQAGFLKQELGPTERKKVFFIHSPQAIANVDKTLGGKPPHVEHTIVGHIHWPPAIRSKRVITPELRQKYRVRPCPSLTANRIPGEGGGGAFFIGTVGEEVRVLRYSLFRNEVWYVDR